MTRCSLRGATTVPFLLAGIALVATVPAAADEPSGLAAASAIQDAFVKAIETAEKSVVSISRDKQPLAAPAEHRLPFGRERGFEAPAPGDAEWVPNEFGAGIIIDDRGLILTNYHLVRGGPIEGKQEI